MKLTLPLPPNLANGRGHWRKRYAKQTAYMQKCDTLQLIGKVPRPPREPVGGKISATFYVWSLNDLDNLMARFKWAGDWLVTRGYIAGDSPRDIEWAGIPEQVVDRKNPRLVITITPVPQEKEAA